MGVEWKNYNFFDMRATKIVLSKPKPDLKNRHYEKVVDSKPKQLDSISTKGAEELP